MLVACGQSGSSETIGPREIARTPGAIEGRSPLVTVDIDPQSPDIYITDLRDESEPRHAYIHREGVHGATTSSVGPAWVAVISDGRGRAWPYDGKGDGIEIPGALDGALIDWTAERMIVARGREVRVLDSTQGFAEVAHWTLPAEARALAAREHGVAIASAMGVAIHDLDGTLRWRVAVGGARQLSWGTQLSVEIDGPTTLTYSVP